MPVPVWLPLMGFTPSAFRSDITKLFSLKFIDKGYKTSLLA